MYVPTSRLRIYFWTQVRAANLCNFVITYNRNFGTPEVMKFGPLNPHASLQSIMEEVLYSTPYDLVNLGSSVIFLNELKDHINKTSSFLRKTAELENKI